ncbi:inactive protein kinase SELMODRAFT_444075-like isoform X2 [Populus nigra]|uniref:inactive protein kinase SELMODRAFT_444075-like isoform X2 n=1 Tax=Populus nigra TaxID=3691 RepID=UPI002B267E5B|nr:inactive protein kinase SELMODRAFT_444075-like isoform X2 [Populus nigra]
MFQEKTEQQQSQQRATNTVADQVVIAVKAEKVMSKAALAWALTHVVHPGDCITLLAVFSNEKSGKKFWNFPRLAGDCGSNQLERLPDRVCEISENCSQMVLQFHNQIEVGVRIKVVSSTPGSVVAAEARRNGANWVVLDKKLRQELKHCIEELHCNIVVMKGSKAKVLRLNLGSSNEIQTPYYSAASSPGMDVGKLLGHSKKHSTPVSSPEEQRLNEEKYKSKNNQSNYDDQLRSMYSDGERIISLSTDPISAVTSDQKSVFWIPQNHIVDEKAPITRNCKNTCEIKSPTSRTLLDKFVQYDRDARAGRLDHSHQKETVSSGIKHAVSLGRNSSVPPPLCSLCQHKAPTFGKPPRQFSYEELEEATEGFSDMNFLAEGGFSNVYRGVLRDGQVVAVKLLKYGGSQADADFCREVRVLSCAQHRNVVLLIGFCIDGKKRVLVYEYICNRSLEFHLHGNKRPPLDWNLRMKIAIGTARGLRYLHEDCRVGCVVHRDMRPNNILVTHDFEPMVADFGLARWHAECNISSEGRVNRTSGYLAPEYINSGKTTPTVDVFAFGVVLLELMTGQRISKLQFYKGQNFLSDLIHPVSALEPCHALENIYQLLDPCLASEQLPVFAYQLQAVGVATSLCLRQDPETRPPMSKVLRILEGGDLAVPLSLDLNSVGNRSGRLHGVSLNTQPDGRRGHSRKLSH